MPTLRTARLAIAFALAGPALGACSDDAAPAPPVFEARDLARHVDPMIGTKGSGNVIPGALVPHGMVRLSPDSVSPSGSIDAYEYGDTELEGFTHTHLEGPGGSLNGYSQILFLPMTGPADTNPETRPSAFDHASEVAEPGYYAVTLDTYGVRAELTAAARAGVHRYTFPESATERGVLVDLAHSNGQPLTSFVEVVDDVTLRGFASYNVHPALNLLASEPGPTALATVYFHATFDVPFSDHAFFRGSEPLEPLPGGLQAEGRGAGVRVAFDASVGDVVEARVGISFIDMDQARANLDADVVGRTFDAVRAGARAAWNDVLNRIHVDGEGDALTVFYTALYHSAFQPADYTEAGGRFQAAFSGEHEVFEADGYRYHTDDWCIWDTFRTTHPLATLTDPARQSDIVRSLLHVYQQGGWLPKCTWHATGYSRVMIGHHAVSIIADAYVKELRDYDADLAWEAMAKAATGDVDNPGLEGLCGYLSLGTTPAYMELGYVPTECDGTQSASMTLELAYDDWAMARFAEAAGREADRAHYDARAASWRVHFDPATGFARGLHADGSFVEPFDPTDRSEANDFAEATSWIYSFFVPHDVPGLIEAMGGPAAFVDRLDRFFAEGHYDPSNQPSFHVPWLYTRAGEPGKTQRRVRQVLEDHYRAEPGGLPGNDDAGSTSAWAVLASLGLYPLAPGDGRWDLASPIFERAVIWLDPAEHPGDAFVIEAVGTSPDALYVQSAELNGRRLDRAWLRHDEIVAGGRLTLTMGAEPSAWGAPPTAREETP